MITTNSELFQKFKDFSKTLNQAERENYKTILSLACRKALSKGHENLQKEDFDLFNTTALLLGSLQPHSKRVTNSGIAWRGRPEFLNDDLLRQIQEEANLLQPKAIRIGDQWVVTGGRIAHEVGRSRELVDLLASHAGPIVSTEKSNYMYYNQEGMGTDPHIDSQEYPLNVILILKHQCIQDPSSFLLFPLNEHLQRVQLQPGELIAFYADSVVHARERMKKDEILEMAAFGFTFVNNQEKN